MSEEILKLFFLFDTYVCLLSFHLKGIVCLLCLFTVSLLYFSVFIESSFITVNLYLL